MGNARPELAVMCGDQGGSLPEGLAGTAIETPVPSLHGLDYRHSNMAEPVHFG